MTISRDRLDRFDETVGIKFQLYNSLFLSLPFYGVDRTGILLSLFNEACENGPAEGQSPSEIVEAFIRHYGDIDLLFRFVQYVERQVVLFDALEDAAFSDIHDMEGKGTLSHLLASVEQTGNFERLEKRLNEFSIRLVLTAHPTQFYPGTVLGIINDLVVAIDTNDIPTINILLQQLGRTPFFKKQRPTPFDEASSQIWYLENVFYQAVGSLLNDLRPVSEQLGIERSDLVRLGFWSGGDRDGNPFVTSETTLQVGRALRKAILRCYHRDVKRLKRRLTFAGVDAAITELESALYREAFVSETATVDIHNIEEQLVAIRNLIVEKHNGLFVGMLDTLIQSVRTFGLHFATLDIRQEASVHESVIDELIEGYAAMSADEKIAALLAARTFASPDRLEGIAADTLSTIGSVKTIRSENGPRGCERYIISQCGSAVNVIEILGLFRLAGWKNDEIAIDVVPLFETIDDLEQASETMLELYTLPEYREHLRRRGDRQTIMLGFSDGTKDGGYLMANWSIYKAKDDLTRLAREHGISVVFFDGRGGPPARGGGRTHRFYASMGGNIANESIELTIQGQTVSSNFGTTESARFNIEQLMNAGLYNPVFSPKDSTFTDEDADLTARLARASFEAYSELKNDPRFLKYLSDVSPLRFYAQANISSRPSKRGQGELTLKDLRAIPFVGAWSQIKQNVPGFYGVGSALESVGNIERVAQMYRENAFFKALIDNCEMAMHKTHFGLTAFLEHDPVYGPIWRKIRDEFDRTRVHLAKVTGNQNLMGDLPVEQRSVSTREHIVLPLVTIQQYALTRLRANPDAAESETLEKLVIRCSFGIINAGRNSA